MPTLLQINSVANSGSTGHIAEDIGRLAIANGWESYIAYGRKALPSTSHLIKIGNKFEVLFHGLITRLFDLHGLASYLATKKLIHKIEQIKPDIIHLHNIHGYYLNYKILFKYLAKSQTPVVWTMHDCWPITGHCAYYSFAKCDKCFTKRGCYSCNIKKDYPSCMLFSNAAYNFKCKKAYFNLLKEDQLTIVTPSQWLSNEIGKSYLGNYKRFVINNGIDLTIFKPIKVQEDFSKKTILGVASTWDTRKGLDDFVKLASFLKKDEEIVLVGLSEKQIAKLPKEKNIRGIRRTESQAQLAELYSQAVVYFNASVEETFGMTCVESIACGTPVIAYNSTAIPEVVSDNTGIILEEIHNIPKAYEAFQLIKTQKKDFYTKACWERAKKLYDKEQRFEEYIKLYKEIIRQNNKIP